MLSRTNGRKPLLAEFSSIILSSLAIQFIGHGFAGIGRGVSLLCPAAPEYGQKKSRSSAPEQSEVLG
jgi:hypothetical protein